MTRSMLQSTWILAVFVLTGAACGPSTNDSWEEPFEVSGPVQAENKIVYLNETLEQLYVLEPNRSDGEAALDVEKTATGSDPGQMALSNDRSQLYVLEPGDDALGVYDLEESPPTRNSVELDSPYDRVTVDPEGEFLLLSFSGDDTDCIACNLNEVGVVDLRTGVPDEAQFVTLPKRARELAFAPNFSLGGENQRLVAALAESQISLIDLEALTSGNQDDGVRNVPLTVSQADQVKQPRQAVFDVTASGDDDEGANSASLYLLTEGGNDIVQVSIKPSNRSSETGRKLDLSVNQLAAGNNPSAMTVLDLPDVGTRLLALDSNEPRFHLVDVESGEGNSFELPLTAPAEDILVYQTVVETAEGESTETRALAWSSQSELVAVIRPESISISSDDPTVGRSVEAIRLEAVPTVVRMDETGERERAVAPHGGADPGFSVLDLEGNRNNATFIKGSSLEDLQFAGNTAFGVFTERPNFGRFDLETGHPTTFELPSPGKHILYDSEDEVILVDHAEDHGEFTVLDANEPKPGTSQVYEGLFIRGLLQAEFPESD